MSKKKIARTPKNTKVRRAASRPKKTAESETRRALGIVASVAKMPDGLAALEHLVPFLLALDPGIEKKIAGQAAIEVDESLEGVEHNLLRVVESAAYGSAADPTDLINALGRIVTARRNLSPLLPDEQRSEAAS